MNVVTTIVEETLHSVVSGLIKQPEKLVITATPAGSLLIANIKVDDRDFGKVLGAQVANLNALRVMVALIGEKHGQNIRLTLEDPAQRIPNRDPFVPATNWDKRVVEDIACDVAGAIFKLPHTISTTDVNNNTVIDIEVSPREQITGGLDLLKTALETIFKAIGKAKGRTIFLNVARAAVPA